MRSRPLPRAAAVVASAAAVLAGTALASASATTGQPGSAPAGIKHVLLISVDGLHQQDLAWYVRNYPRSVLATLDRRGVEYSNAMTPFPSDSFPGMVGQVAGGNPPGSGHGSSVTTPVETTQIAPTIPTLLGLRPGELQAVRIEHTQVLPGL